LGWGGGLPPPPPAGLKTGRYTMLKMP